MSIGNLKTQGGKGTNYPYQLRVLELLASISGGVVPPGGLATEATALQILASVQNGRDFEQTLVYDTGGVGCPNDCPVYIQIRIYDPNTGTFGPPTYYNAAGAVVVPVGPVVFLNNAYILQNILNQVTATNAQKTPTSFASTGVTNVPIGATEVSVFNSGSGDALCNGVILPAGVTRTFGFKNPIAAQIVCNGNGTELLIIDYMI